jgi:hypothetical protein
MFGVAIDRTVRAAAGFVTGRRSRAFGQKLFAMIVLPPFTAKNLGCRAMCLCYCHGLSLIEE